MPDRQLPLEDYLKPYGVPFILSENMPQGKWAMAVDPARPDAQPVLMMPDGDPLVDELLYAPDGRFRGPIIRAHRDMDRMAKAAKERAHRRIDEIERRYA
jgi:hypothetical protein